MASLYFNRDVRALAVDPRDDSVWTLADQQLFSFDPSGTLQQTVDLKTFARGLGEPKFMAVDPYDASLWVGGEKTMLHLTSGGQLLSARSVPPHFESFVLDTDESLWILTQKRLLHLSAEGTSLANYMFSGTMEEPKLLAVDDLGGNLWIAWARTLLQFNLADLKQRPRTISLPASRSNPQDGAPDDGRQAPEVITAIATDPLSGRLLVATKNQLDFVNINGAIQQTLDLPALGLQQVKKLALEPISMSFWLGGKQEVGQFDRNGQFMGAVNVDGKVKAIGTAPFELKPTLSLLAPPDGILTNNPWSTLKLGLGAACNGIPCSVGTGYTDSLSLDVSLDNQAIGQFFSIASDEATYSPPVRLPEGVNTLVAQAKDRFGHYSDQLTAHFTIDTIPPKFLTISPADGSVVSTSAVMIQGTLDDPTATVMLLNASGNVLSMASGAKFSFAVTLSPGVNTFKLVARDPAGNVTVASLALNYSSALSVTVTSITTGATVDTNSLLVSGNVSGPENTGVTVNGVVAVIANGKFYVNDLALQPGSNTLTVTATSPDGRTVTQTLTVVSAGPSPYEISVEPQSGVAPLAVTFTVSGPTPSPISQIAVDFGAGTTSSTTTDPTAPITFTYSTPGIYLPKITITDDQGATYTQSLAVVVYDPAHMDQLFKSIWDGMNSALQSGDSAGASRYLDTGARIKYKPIFDALLPYMPQIIASYSPLQRVTIWEDIGEYAVNRTYLGENRLYLIYFLKDADGVWRVDAM